MAKLAKRSLIAGVGVSFALLIAIPIAAQPSKTSPRSTTTPTGAYDQLSPAQRKIADALYEAQTTNGATTPLTRDQIAAQKTGKRWNDVFRSMKAQGLLQERSIGQVMSSYAQRHRPGSTVGAKPPTVNRGRSKTTTEKESKRKADPDSVRATSDGTTRDDATDGAATSPERGGAAGRRGSRSK